MTLTDSPAGEKLFTAADVLEIALAAYGKGLQEGRADASRDRWRDLAVVDPFRAARIRTEVAAMKDRAAVRYLSRCYPEGYDYRGGEVDWETGLPARSGCAWLRNANTYSLVGGPT